MQEEIIITPELTIPVSEMEIFFSKSGGPGGQNVNKVNSKVFLRWPLSTSPRLTDEMRLKIQQSCRTYITEEGDILLYSDRFRTQKQNREDCLSKLQKILEVALRPQKARVKTRVSKANKERRLQDKKLRSKIKKNRRSEE